MIHHTPTDAQEYQEPFEYPKNLGATSGGGSRHTRVEDVPSANRLKQFCLATIKAIGGKWAKLLGVALIGMGVGSLFTPGAPAAPYLFVFGAALLYFSLALSIVDCANPIKEDFQPNGSEADSYAESPRGKLGTSIANNGEDSDSDADELSNGRLSSEIYVSRSQETSQPDYSESRSYDKPILSNFIDSSGEDGELTNSESEDGDDFIQADTYKLYSRKSENNLALHDRWYGSSTNPEDSEEELEPSEGRTRRILVPDFSREECEQYEARFPPKPPAP